MAKIALIIGLLIIGGAVIYTCVDIFGGIRREMEDVSEDWRLMTEDWRLKNQNRKFKIERINK